MRQREVEMLYEYLWNNETRLESDVANLQQNVRYRCIDAVDCLELCLALERLHTFRKVSKDIRQLLRLYERRENSVL